MEFLSEYKDITSMSMSVGYLFKFNQFYIHIFLSCYGLWYGEKKYIYAYKSKQQIQELIFIRNKNQDFV